jgi:cytochrome c-type biogenesis protein CcmH/NrfF
VRRFAGAVVLTAGLLGLTTHVSDAGQREVEERLACQCGCGLTVHTCNHLQCSFAVPVREEVARRLADGDAEEDIIAGYVAEYGEKVLSSPTHEGFNLLAWWGPYGVLVVGTFGLAMTLRRLRKVAPVADAASLPRSTPENAEARARLEQELRDLDR